MWSLIVIDIVESVLFWKTISNLDLVALELNEKQFGDDVERERALFLILLLLLHHICATKDYQEQHLCPPSSCGKITNIRYPFRLQGDPKKCGKVMSLVVRIMLRCCICTLQKPRHGHGHGEASKSKKCRTRTRIYIYIYITITIYSLKNWKLIFI